MKKKIIAVLLIIAVLTAIFIFSRRCGSGDKAQEKLILTENQLAPFLNIRGWKVSGETCDAVTIPESFDGVYAEFAGKMKQAGYNLDSHKGEEVKRFTYSVDNYGDGEVIAELLLTPDNELICAALIELKPDGFTEPI